ncbi:MAG TPA: MgtC/SapB family protein, partial [Blastocatellia bacterium]|nr:MgtC/SapB family protein [Blastocatellia bacterium]
GVIMREGLTVRGLNTAATLWCAAAIGALAGAGWKLSAAIGALAVLVIHISLRPLAHRINRHPLAASDVEIQYRLLLTCCSEDESHIRAVLMRTVGAESIMLRGLYSEDEADSSKVDVRADLLSVGRNDILLEQLVSHLSLEPGISAVSWEIVGHDSTANG